MAVNDSKRYCGILPYFGSASYLYERMPMGLNISPSIWQSCINAILGCLQSRKHCKVIMENLLLYHILLPIDHYIGNSTIKCHSRSMSDNRDLTETFHQKISSYSKFIASAF